MSAAMYAAIKELTARVEILEEKLAAQSTAQITAAQKAELENQRQTLRLNLKKAANN